MDSTRRTLLLGLGGALAIAETFGPKSAQAGTGQPKVIPWIGPHQAGVTTARTPFGLFAAFDVLATNRQELRDLLVTLTARIASLTTSGPIQQAANPLEAPPESGLLGATRTADSLAITVSLGASLFEEDRFGLAAQRPAQLTPMDRFPNDAIDPALAHGDLLLQITADSRETVLHALRDLIRHTGTWAGPRWQIEGFLPPAAATPDEETPRNMLGFKDGTANPDAADAAQMDKLVWVPTGAAGEPAWTAGGSYQVIRLIRNFVERWDRAQLASQEAIIGRHKLSGEPLGQGLEHAVPDFSGDGIPPTAHIRLANPRTAATAKSIILRRGYNYARGLDASGRIDMGLIFVSYQADLDAGFRTVQTRLNGEALEEYIKPFGGGYFFVLPGVASDSSFLGEALLSAT
jgi:deferrochelatase/peroxidase EfeB